jgi:hypothetical protein
MVCALFLSLFLSLFLFLFFSLSLSLSFSLSPCLSFCVIALTPMYCTILFRSIISHICGNDFLASAAAPFILSTPSLSLPFSPSLCDSLLHLLPDVLIKWKRRVQISCDVYYCTVQQGNQKLLLYQSLFFKC